MKHAISVFLQLYGLTASTISDAQVLCCQASSTTKGVKSPTRSTEAAFCYMCIGNVFSGVA